MPFTSPSDLCLKGTMKQTREEKNRAASNRRFAIKMKRRDSCIEEFVRLYDNARKWQHERQIILEARKAVWESEAFKLLPEIWREFVRGAAHVLCNQFENELIWTHIHPKTGVRTRTKDKSLEGLHGDIDTEKSCFCYELMIGNFIPIDEKHRE